MKKAASPKQQQRKARALSVAMTELARDAKDYADAFCDMLARVLIALREHAGLDHEETATRAKIPPATVRSV